MDLLREYWWIAAIVVGLVVAFLLLRPRQRVKLTDSAPARAHMAYAKPREGRGLAGEHAAAASDVAGDIISAPVHGALDGRVAGDDRLDQMHPAIERRTLEGLDHFSPVGDRQSSQRCGRNHDRGKRTVWRPFRQRAGECRDLAGQTYGFSGAHDTLHDLRGVAHGGNRTAVSRQIERRFGNAWTRDEHSRGRSGGNRANERGVRQHWSRCSILPGRSTPTIAARSR